KALRPRMKSEVVAEHRAQAARLRKRLAEVVEIDFFGAIGREGAERALAELEARLTEDVSTMSNAKADPKASTPAALHNRTWVTRQGVHVDRIGSAWLIRRFIDPEARFKFVAGKGYRPAEGELRFDMFQAEFTHEGDKCTFEVLLDRVASKDPALRAIAEIIHYIHLMDNKYALVESVGVRPVL